MTTLAELKTGDKALVTGLQGGCGAQRHLAEMGLAPGCRLEIISTGNGGRVLLESSRGRLALGHGMANKVIVNTKAARS